MTTGVEIERKFLVDHAPIDPSSTPGETIWQGYLASENGVEVRIRTRGDRAFLTVKKGAGIRRAEEEIEIDTERFERLWLPTDGRQLTKTRYRVPVGDLDAELDVYGGPLEGLMTVDGEFASEADADGFVAPEWFGPDISDDPRYRNRELAEHGSPPF